LPKGEVR